MNKGAVLIAHNSGELDYVNMAIASAERIKRHLKLPVTLVTDTKSWEGKEYTGFDHVIYVEPDETNTRIMYQGKELVKTVWCNKTRAMMFALSPYKETLLLDSDYVVCSDQLLKLFGSKQAFLCHNLALDVTDRHYFMGHRTFGNKMMPMYWATVMYWRKEQDAEEVFKMVEMVQDNYTHYAALYGFPDKPFRNDYALSIALATLSGHVRPTEFIPWQLATTDVDVVVELDGDNATLKYDDNGVAKYLTLSGQDLHVMNKKCL